MGDSLSYLDNLLVTLMTVESVLIKFCTGFYSNSGKIPAF